MSSTEPGDGPPFSSHEPLVPLGPDAPPTEVGTEPGTNPAPHRNGTHRPPTAPASAPQRIATPARSPGSYALPPGVVARPREVVRPRRGRPPSSAPPPIDGTGAAMTSPGDPPRPAAPGPGAGRAAPSASAPVSPAAAEPDRTSSAGRRTVTGVAVPRAPGARSSGGRRAATERAATPPPATSPAARDAQAVAGAPGSAGGSRSGLSSALPPAPASAAGPRLKPGSAAARLMSRRGRTSTAPPRSAVIAPGPRSRHADPGGGSPALASSGTAEASRATRASRPPPLASPERAPALEPPPGSETAVGTPTRHKPNTTDIHQIMSRLDSVADDDQTLPTAPAGIIAAPGQDTGDDPAGPATASAGGGAPAVDTVTTSSDRAALKALFEELAGHYMFQVRDLMIEVRCGSALAEWIDLAQPAVSSLRKMADQMEMADLDGALERLVKVMAEIRQGGGVITGDRRETLLAAYQPLIELLPAAFELDAERSRREPIIVHALLRQIPGVEKVAIDKIASANLFRVAALADARADEVAQVTGLSPALAQRVVARFRAYLARAGAVAAPDPAAEHRSLAQLVDRLRQQNRAYEEASDRWSDEARESRRQLRRERAETLLRMHLSLARLGQVDRLAQLDKLSFRRKADHVETFLQSVHTRRETPAPGTHTTSPT